MRLLTLLLLLVVALTGCAEQTGSVPPSPSRWRDCTMARADAGGRVLARSVEDGDRLTFKLFAPGRGPCAGGLVLRFGSGVAGADASRLALDPASARVVRLHDAHRSWLLVVLSRPDAEGGVQAHLFTSVGGGNLAELRSHGHPLLAAMAPRTGTTATASCARDGGVTVLTATAHQPAGIVLSWDVRRSTYIIGGDGSTRLLTTAVVARGVADPTLRRTLPQLYRPTAVLSDC